MIKNYRGFNFRFNIAPGGRRVAVSIQGAYNNWMQLGTVAPNKIELQEFLSTIVDSGAAAHLAYI